MTSFLKKTAAVAALSLVATPAFAHTGGTVLGFHSGVLHPVYGLDHLMAMVAVGVWSAAQPTRRAWHGPAPSSCGPREGSARFRGRARSRYRATDRSPERC